MQFVRSLKSLYSSIVRKYEILDFPYPYHSMLAINSDVEWTSWVMQQKLIEYFCNLRLDCSYSYWFYAGGDKTWTLFKKPGKRSEFFDDAVELMRAGVLDANHGFGGRRHCGGINFNRGNILSDYGQLAECDVRTPIFSNHGSQQDTQNIGGDWATYQEGDVPGSDSYHLDRTLAQGVRFFWTDIDYLIDKTYLQPSFNRDNSLFRTQKCRDGNSIICFRRYLGNLSAGSCAQNIDQQLEPLLSGDANGYVVLYQHLGVHRSPDGKPHSASEPIFPVTCVEALEKLADLHHSGSVLVTTTHRLLNHALMMAVKPWEIREENNSIAVHFRKHGNAGGVEVRFHPEDFSGWTVRVQKNWTVRAFYGEQQLMLERKDVGDSAIFTLPWKRTEGESHQEAAQYCHLD